MGRLTQLIIMMAAIAGFASSALASPTIDSLNVQGYLKKANGQQVTDGTYTLAFGVFQNGTIMWAKSYSVTVTNGLFSRSLSGVGTDLSALPGSTGMNQNYSAGGLNVTLNPALLVAGGSGGITIRVYAVTAIDSTNPQFDLTIASVPTAMVCESAKGVVADSVTVAGLAPGAKTTISAGSGDVGKLALLDADGKFDLSTIPDLPGSAIASGSVAVANGGTGSTDGSITGTGSVIYQSAAGSSTAVGNNTSSSSLDLRSGTGGIAATVTGTAGDIALTAGTATGNIAVSAGSSGTVTVGSTSTGTATFGNTGAGASTTVRSGTGGIAATVTGTAGDVALTAGSATGNVTLTPGTGGTVTAGSTSTGAATFGNTGAGAVSTLQGGSQAVVSSAGTTSSAVSVSVSGVGGGITLAPEATGNFVAGGGSTSGNLTIGNASIGTATFGNTGAASATTLRSGTGGITAAVTGTTGNVAITAGTASGTITVGNASTGTTLLGNTGSAAITTIQSPVVNVGSGATTTTVNLGGTGLTALTVGSSSTSALTTTVGGTNTTSATIIQAGTGKVKIGSTGIAVTAMGGCNIAAAGAITNTGQVTRTCTGLPATNVAVWCSPQAALTTPATNILHCRPSAANTVSCGTSAANSVNFAMSCMWIQP